MTTYRVIIQFQESRIAYMAHTPTEVQRRGYHNDRFYVSNRWANELKLFTDAATPDEAVTKAKQLLLKFVEES